MQSGFGILIKVCIDKCDGIPLVLGPDEVLLGRNRGGVQREDGNFAAEVIETAVRSGGLESISSWSTGLWAPTRAICHLRMKAVPCGAADNENHAFSL